MEHAWVAIFGCSIFQAFLSTVLSIGLALPVAHFLYRFNVQGERLLLALVPLLCIMPTKLAALGVSLFYGATGLPGIILGHCMLNIPFAFYLLYGTYQKCDYRWEQIARQYGASSWQCYRDIYLPILWPTLIAASAIIFVLCFSSVGIPLMLGTHDWHMTPDVHIARYFKDDGWQSAALYFVLRLLVVAPLSMVYTSHSRSPWTTHHAPIRYRPARHSLGDGGWVLLCLIAGLITLGPLGALLVNMANYSVFTFLHSIAAGAQDPILGVPIYRVVFNSLILALLSSMGALLVGFGLAKGMQRTADTRSKMVVGLLVSFPFILGGVGSGALFAWLAQVNVLSASLVATLCHVLLNYTFAYRIFQAQVVLWQPEWSLVAQSFGGTRWQQMYTLDLPFIRSALQQAFCITFGLSLTEVGAGNVLNSGLTLPMAIRIYREQGCMDGVMGLSLILLGLVVLVAWYQKY